MGVFSTWTERLETGLRFTIPCGFMLCLLLLGIMSFPSIIVSNIKLPFVLMAIYYWSIYHPSLFPVWLALIAGVITDVVLGVPLGMYALIFVLFRWFVVNQRRFLMGQYFMIIWLGFGVLSAVSEILQWLIFGIIGGAWLSLPSQIWAWGVGASIFPFIYWLLHLTHKALPFASAASPYTIKGQSRYRGGKH